MTGLRERQKQDRKRRILEAARRQFRAASYRVVTIEAIADAAALSPMTVFNYYESKGGLLLALVAESDRQLIKKIDMVLRTNHHDALTAIIQFSETIFNHAFSYLDRPIWAQVLATSIRKGNSTFGRGFTTLEWELKKLLAQLLDILKNGNLINTDFDSQVAATVIYNVHNARFTEFAANSEMTRSQTNQLIKNDLGFIVKLISQ